MRPHRCRSSGAVVALGLAASRLGTAVGTLASVEAVAWAFAWPDADRLAAALVAALGLCVALMVWRVGIHPSLAATETGLVIRNPLETVRVPWADLVEASAGFDGITISRLSAPPTTIWAVQKSNLSTWRGAPTRADDVAATIQVLASARGRNAETIRLREQCRSPDGRFGRSTRSRSPLRSPWRMTRVEATVIGFLRHSSSPLPNAASALVFGALGLILVGLFASDEWDAHLLRDRGVVVQATVVEVPGLVKVTSPAIAPQAMFLEGGDRAARGVRDRGGRGRPVRPTPPDSCAARRRRARTWPRQPGSSRSLSARCCWRADTRSGRAGSPSPTATCRRLRRVATDGEASARTGDTRARPRSPWEQGRLLALRDP